jgi:hypothetical protein
MDAEGVVSRFGFERPSASHCLERELPRLFAVACRARAPVPAKSLFIEEKLTLLNLVDEWFVLLFFLSASG